MGDNGYYYATPAEVQDDEELECNTFDYAMRNFLKLWNINTSMDWLNTKHGNILMVRIDLGKTSDKNDKGWRYPRDTF